MPPRCVRQFLAALIVRPAEQELNPMQMNIEVRGIRFFVVAYDDEIVDFGGQ